MKLLFIEICNFIDYPLGGHLSFAKHLAYAMQGSMDLVGSTTEVYAPIGKWHLQTIEGYEYNKYNIVCERQHASRPLVPRRLSVYFALKRHVKHIDFDKYEALIVQTPEVLLALPKSVLSKVILIMPGVENPVAYSRYKRLRFLSSYYDKVFFRRAQHVRCLLAAADRLSIGRFVARSKGKLSENKVVQFPTRYDANVFKIQDKYELREKYNIHKDDIIIVTTGRLNRFKGWKLMIDAFGQFIVDNNSASSKFYFLGDGEDQDEIHDYIVSKNLAEKIILQGNQTWNVVADFLSMADLFVMGSFYEGWSTSLVEAVAAGVPCVCTNFSSAKEMIEYGVNGFVIDSRDEQEFAKKMSEALQLPKESVESMSEKIQILSVQNMKSEFEKILSENFAYQE